MSTFVLVHGAWAGSFGFRHVRRLLQQAGHEVFTPSLTGLGERVHLISPQVSLSTHVLDVANQILYEDLSDIVLMGFSYGGFVVTAALEHVHTRVRHLVYLDAFVPQHGDTVLSHIVGTGRAPMQLGQNWQMPASERHFDDPEEGAWMRPRRGPQPRGTFTEPVYLAQPLEDYPFTRTYIKATRDPETDIGAKQLLAAAERARTSPAWRYEEIATTHMVASNQPLALVKILLNVAMPA